MSKNKGVFGGRETDDEDDNDAKMKKKKKRKQGRGHRSNSHSRRKVVILGEIPDDDGASETTTTAKPDIAAVTLLFEAFVERMKTDTPDPIVSKTYRRKSYIRMLTSINRGAVLSLIFSTMHHFILCLKQNSSHALHSITVRARRKNGKRKRGTSCLAAF